MANDEGQRRATPWRMTMGASVTAGGVHFQLWAPKAARVEVVIEDAAKPVAHAMTPAAEGVFSADLAGIGAGTRYRYRLDGDASYPDPYSRSQPAGPHGPSAVIDPGTFQWSDESWGGLAPEGQVIYECHVGTMTAEGTFEALIAELPELKRLGVTAIEIMPVATFPGRWNWGYDGVNLFAPSPVYGTPEQLRRLIDAAHQSQLGVLLDVVYNHFGPDGNYLRLFSDDYFTDRHTTPWGDWGDALNYDGPGSRFVRDLVIDNACYWLSEYHFDGLRLDATDTIIDDSPTHLLAELGERARAATPRQIILIAEEARNDVRTIRPRAAGGYGLDGVWADDFHHAVHVALTGEREGYYADFAGTPSEIATALGEGFIFQGQPLRSGASRGTPVTDEPAHAFVVCLQNHDQVGNRAYGERLHHQIDAGCYAAASALLLFAPQTPLLFMGQEFAASQSFMFFTDHVPELGHHVTEGRRREFQGFRAFADPALRETIPDPQAAETFYRSKLDPRERKANPGIYRLYHDLLALRQADPVIATPDRFSLRAAVIGAETLAVHRWRGDQHRLLVANFGPSLGIAADDPALAGMPRNGAQTLLSTAARRYGGHGGATGMKGRGAARQLEIPARAAVLFAWDAPAAPATA